MTFFTFSLAILMGAAVSVYIPMTAQTARILGAPILGNLPFFFFGLVTSVVLVFATGNKLPTAAKFADVPTWLLLAGVFSAAIILGNSYLIPRIGTNALFVLLVAGQIVFGIFINHFGLLGVPVQPATMAKIAGSVLVLGGAFLVSFGDSLFQK